MSPLSIADRVWDTPATLAAFLAVMLVVQLATGIFNPPGQPLTGFLWSLIEGILR
jgi:hypothetical protein